MRKFVVLVFLLGVPTVTPAAEEQKGSCRLELETLCADYSKNISFGGIELGKAVDVESIAKTNGFFVKKLESKRDIRFFLFKTEMDQKNGSQIITIYTAPGRNSEVKYFTWNDSKNGLNFHLNGMRKFLEKVKGSDLSGSESMIDIGPNSVFFKQQVTIGIKSLTAGIGIRPPEVDILPYSWLLIWHADETPTIFFENIDDCLSSKKGTCSFAMQTKDVKIKPYSKRKGAYGYVYQYALEAPMGPVFRSPAFADLEECNRTREWFLHTDTEMMKYQAQSECIIFDKLK